MNKTIAKMMAGLLSAMTLFTAGVSPVTAQDKKVIRVASHLEPMTDIVELAGKNIADGYEIELVQVNDNVQYNEAVLNDEAFASFAQHRPFMEDFNQNRDGDLVAVLPVYNAVVGFYSPTFKSIDDITDGAEVAIPGDKANEARALLILEHHGLIKLDKDAGLFPTVDHITENPKNLKFTHTDLLNLTAAYEDGVDLVFNYPTYIAKVGLTPKDAVLVEDSKDLTYAISVVMRKGNVDTPEAKALLDAFKSQAVIDFVDNLAKDGNYVNVLTQKGSDSEVTSESGATSESSSNN